MLKLPEKSDSQTDTKILLDAISKDKMHLVKFILDALDGKIIDSKTEGAKTPLISSVFLSESQTRCKFMNLLLHRGASVNQQDESGRTALSYACEKGYLDAVKILVKNNADPEMVDTWGNTALMYAAVSGHSLVVEFLVRAFKRLGLQINRQNKVGNSAVEVAKHLGHRECLFALTSNSKKVHDNSGFCENVSKMNTTNDNDEDKDRIKRKSLILQSRLQSMDSIEELEKESDSLPSSPRGLVFSSVLTPKPPKRSGVFQKSKQMDELLCDGSLLPPVTRVSEHQLPFIYSPRPSKTSKSGAQTTLSSYSSNALSILLTPIGKSSKDESDKDRLKRTPFDMDLRRFDDSYYQKRSSLPTSVLSPSPPERSLTPLRKTKPFLRNFTSPVDSEPVESIKQPSTTFSVFGNKLLRRFTFPEFKKPDKDAHEGECSMEGRGCELASRVIPRSETFPLARNHPQVGSKPSIDSISAVKCEFDFQLKPSSSKFS